MIRQPVVAGTFYPGSKTVLERDLADMIDVSENKRKVIGLVSPHAGYIYSGSCAGKGFGQVEIPDTVIILGVNHHGMGHPYAVDGHDSWRTPLGEVRINTQLRDQLIENSDIFQVDSSAGSREHSLEVQVPFIQYLNPDATILPVAISSLDKKTLMEAGKELAKLIKANGNILMVASSDMSHYIDADSAKKRDELAIARILQLDPEGLFDTVSSNNISMCGVSPTTMMLAASLVLGGQRAEIIDYTHSGKASGDYQQVVAYLSLALF